MDLLNRALIDVRGKDRLTLLQSLVTQDLSPAAPAHYTLLLTPQGRYAFDFFVVTAADGTLYLDAPAFQADDLIAALNKYKLRSDVTFTRVAPAALEIAFEPPATPALLAYADPRNLNLGWRIWRATERFSESVPPAAYKILLTRCCIIEPALELAAGTDLPLEFGMLASNAISFTKGCYVGQELTARTQHKGLVKHKILLVEDERLHGRDTPVADADGNIIGTVLRSTPPVMLVRVAVDSSVDNGVNVSGQIVPTQQTLSTC